MAGSSSSVRLDMPSLPQSSSVPSVRRRPFRFSLRDATAQLFCGGSVSAQIGHMKRSFLDFSSILAQLEVRNYLMIHIQESFIVLTPNILFLNNNKD